MPFTVFLRQFERLDGFVKPVHFCENVGAVQTDGRDCKRVAGILQYLFGAFIMRERVVVLVETVVEISECDFEHR